MLLGHRLPERTRSVVTDGLGLVTLLAAALSAAAVLDRPFALATGPGAPVLVVLGSLLLGGIFGSLLRIEDRIETFGAGLQRRLTRTPETSLAASVASGPLAAGADTGADSGAAGLAARDRFVKGFLTASLVFCVGPLTVLGSIDDGLGRGIQQLALKSTLDGFAAIAFAASFGIGVAASALTVAVVQGGLTLVGVVLGDVLPPAHVSALTATGGLLLVGIALRLLRIRDVPVGDLLPALVVAPLLTQLVVVLRGAVGVESSAFSRPRSDVAAEVGGADAVVLAELLAGALTDDLAGLEDVRLVRGAQGLSGVLLDQQDRRPLRVDLPDDREDLRDQLRRQPHRGLVEQQQLRPSHQRPADGQHLLLAAGHRPGRLRRPLLQPREQRVDPVEVLGGGRLAVLARVRAHLQVLQHGHPREDAPSLGSLGDAELDPLVGGHVGDVAPLEHDLT